MEIKYINTNPEIQKNIKNFLSDWYSDTKKIQIQTSGSTGTPKKIFVEKKYMRASAEMTCKFLQLKEGDSALLCLPLQYISGKMMMARACVQNLTLTATAPTLQPLESLPSPIHFAAMTPLQVEHSLEKIHLIEKLIIGGAAVSETLKKKIHAQLSEKNENNPIHSNQIYETYGMSETLSHIALKQIFPKEDDYFQLLPSIHISQDERNCLKISAPHLGIEDLQTNDIIHLTSENTFQFLGRADNIINSGGAKIFPEQLETLAKKTIPHELIFVGIPDEILGQKLILIIEGKKDSQLENMISSIKFEKSFHKPKVVVFVEKISRTPNNKIDRRTMLQQILMK